MQSSIRNEGRFRYLYGGLFAVLVRVLASKTHAHWFHPDEWCQTFEPASLIAHGFGFHSQEIGLHLRNLTWASILAGVLKIAHAVYPSSISLRVFAVNLLCGLLDLGILWGWIQMMKKNEFVVQTSHRVKSWGLALLLLPWFTIYESVSPRAEHLSEIAIWISLGCVAIEAWIAAGVASIAIFAFRYPSALMTLGIAISVLIHSWRIRQLQPFIRFCGGALLGIGIFGLADALIYGRPWESFWMYLQYNVFTGSSAQYFGRQSLLEYKEIFLWNWATYRFLIPLGVFLGVFAVYGLYQGIRKLQPWALCLLIYLVGHALVPHKEGRFMLPAEALIRWSAFLGICSFIPIWPKLRDRLRLNFFEKVPKLVPVAQALSIGFLMAHGFIFLHHLRADFLKDRGVFQEVGIHLERISNVCGILTPVDVTSVLIPFKSLDRIPEPAIGKYIPGSSISWLQRPAQCALSDSILFQAHHTSLQLEAQGLLENQGCELLPSGVFALLPGKLGDWAKEKGMSFSAWYRCPNEILNRFPIVSVQETLSSGFGKIPALPKLGINAENLEILGLMTSAPPRDAVLPSIRHLKAGSDGQRKPAS